MTRQQVGNYVDELKRALTTVRNPKQVLNMDECGFHSRIDKGRERRCVYALDVETEPTFCEETQGHTMSLVATVSLNGDSLKPLFLTPEKVEFKSKGLQVLRDRLLCYTTPRGYQNEESMLYYLKSVIDPYVKNVQEDLHDSNACVFLIMDNCPCHQTPRCNELIRTIVGLRVIWLPPHSSHFLQMLDASPFGILKSAYRQIKPRPEKPRYEAKIVRGFHAWYVACYPGNVISAFQRTGLDFDLAVYGPTRVRINDEVFLRLAEANCGADAREIDPQPASGAGHS